MIEMYSIQSDTIILSIMHHHTHHSSNGEMEEFVA